MEDLEVQVVAAVEVTDHLLVELLLDLQEGLVIAVVQLQVGEIPEEFIYYLVEMAAVVAVLDRQEAMLDLQLEHRQAQVMVVMVVMVYYILLQVFQPLMRAAVLVLDIMEHLLEMVELVVEEMVLGEIILIQHQV